MVRAVVVNYDGGQLTLDCLRSILATDWPPDRLEVVMVDNGSLDNVVERVTNELPQVRIIEPLANTGFARGCNLGIAAPGSYDFVALVNNDAVVSPAWLRPLVSALTSDSGLGAACPKLLFAERYVGVTIEVPDARRHSSDPRTLGVCVIAARSDDRNVSNALTFDEGFFPPEEPNSRHGEEIRRWSWRRAAARLATKTGEPVPSTLSLKLIAPTPRLVRITAGDGVSEHMIDSRPSWISVALPTEPFDVINNAGSSLYPEGFGGDRGFLEPDNGQFDAADDVFAWCGGAVLLRPGYLDDVGVFDERLFLYYEDTDLSWRGQLRGWRYRYVPESVVRHHHAASSVAGSDTFRFYTERNRPLVLLKNAPIPLAGRAVGGMIRRVVQVAVRDVLGPVVRLRRPHRAELRHEARVLRSLLGLAPHALVERRRLRPCRSRDEVMTWTTQKEVAR